MKARKEVELLVECNVNVFECLRIAILVTYTRPG